MKKNEEKIQIFRKSMAKKSVSYVDALLYKLLSVTL